MGASTRGFYDHHLDTPSAPGTAGIRMPGKRFAGMRDGTPQGILAAPGGTAGPLPWGKRYRMSSREIPGANAAAADALIGLLGPEGCRNTLNTLSSSQEQECVCMSRFDTAPTTGPGSSYSATYQRPCCGWGVVEREHAPLHERQAPSYDPRTQELGRHHMGYPAGKETGYKDTEYPAGDFAACSSTPQLCSPPQPCLAQLFPPQRPPELSPLVPAVSFEMSDPATEAIERRRADELGNATRRTAPARWRVSDALRVQYQHHTLPVPNLDRIPPPHTQL